MEKNKISVGTDSTEVIQVLLNHRIGGETSWMAVLYPKIPVRQRVYVADWLGSVH